MCGIVAYLGDKDVQPILLEGLKRLEYRGYDSAGIAVVLDVGASPRGQASSLTLTSRLISALWARVEPGFPVKVIMGIPSRFNKGSSRVISLVSPEFDRAITRS